MEINKNGTNTIIKGDNYEIEIIPEKLLVVIKNGRSFYYAMSMLSAVNMLGRKDISEKFPELRISENNDGSIELIIESDSNIWDNKVHKYFFRSDSIEYSTEIFGNGKIDRVYYFRGTFGKDELACIPGFNRVFSPQVNFLDKRDFFISEYHAIATGNYPELCKAVWGCGLHGAPLCFVFHNDNHQPFMSVGILARPGEFSFHSFEFNYLSDEERNSIPDAIIGTEALSLKYDGHLEVTGHWKTPTLLIRFADDKFNAVKRYLSDLEAFGGNIKRKYPYERWTYEPLFCTWHEQVALGIQRINENNIGFSGLESSDYYFNVLTQDNAERWLEILCQHDIKPGAIILDAKWQVHNGDPFADTNKFPDLRGFIDSCHKKDIKVILWFNGWDREGIPDEECCLIDGKPTKVDPTNPSYRRRIRNCMRRLFSDDEGCYNADGLKLDGMTAPPVGTNLQTYKPLYGFELSRCLIELIYDSAKAVKPQTVIGLFTACPYFADLCDFARTGDLYCVFGDPNSSNAFRVQIQTLVMPEVAKDTDGALRFNCILPDEEIIKHQEKIGVPCIYQAEYLLQKRQFSRQTIKRIDDKLYSAISASWKRYRDENLRKKRP